MTTQEYRPVDVKIKLGNDNNLQTCHKEITELITKVSPEVHQCIAMDEYIIFQGNYHPDGIVVYKIPRKATDYELDKFPEEYREEVQKLQKDLNLTKKQVKELYNKVKTFDMQIYTIEKRLEILRDFAKQLKKDRDMQKQINLFFKSLRKFSECLTSNLAVYDPETKLLIKEELIKLIYIINEKTEKYLDY